ncbi:hypothetical protein DPEC_G00211480 [Dallia pectoralis]|uniref:Uncharacterized protein n=1 Tax=Dallia pectoralis TaxID=75939 RepID=A0ACC2G6B2_DALPE|nr:hypothetical protein DPEC_G00211480 [Dallia pectoralis]
MSIWKIFFWHLLHCLRDHTLLALLSQHTTSASYLLHCKIIHHPTTTIVFPFHYYRPQFTPIHHIFNLLPIFPTSSYQLSRLLVPGFIQVRLLRYHHCLTPSSIQVRLLRNHY